MKPFMKIHRDLAQKSWPWFLARAGKVTGSELKNLITEGLAVRSWKTDMPNTYLHRKLNERWRGEPQQDFQGNQQTDQGIIGEERARNFFASLLESDIETVGGIESDDGHLWCSPDGLIGDRVGLEIKRPNGDTHVGWLLAGGVPDKHVLQVQFPFLLGDFDCWWFLSYAAKYPHLAVKVQRDEALIKTISCAVAAFNEKMDEGFSRLCELNGGPPTERKPFVPSSTSDPRRELFQGIHDPDDVLP